MPQKEWNEDLVRALRARHQQAFQQGKSSQHRWREAADAIEAVRKSIKLTSTDKIYNLPNPVKSGQGLTKLTYETCQRIIRGQETIYPPGFTPLSDAEFRSLEENTVDPYLNKMARKSGAHAILMAFHHGSIEATVTRQRICQTVKDLNLCDEPMDANYHQGRMYGAWKAKDTLIKHGFLLEYKAGVSYTARGFRSNGAHTYSITEGGKRAIKFLLKKWPDTATCSRAGFRWNDSTGGEAPNMDGFAAHTAASPFAPPAFASPAKKTKYSDGDERELRDWVATAPVHSQKSWKVGKERRKFLHRLCDQMMGEKPGLVLEHASSGEVRSRELVVTLKARPTSGAPIVTPFAHFGSTTEELDSTPSLHSASSSANRQLFPDAASSGARLGGASDLMEVGLSARDAAAMAAMDRMEKNGKKRKRASSSFASGLLRNEKQEVIDLLDDSDSDDDSDLMNRKPASNIASNRARNKEQEVIELLDDSDSDNGSDSMNRKPAAKRKRDCPSIDHDFQPGEEVYIKSADGRTNGPFKICRVHITGHVTVAEKPGKETKHDAKNVLPCFDVLDDRLKVKGPTRPQLDDVIEIDRDEAIASMPQKSITIQIDSRERSRNAAPRELRTGLQQQLDVGDLNGIWASRHCKGRVVENTLSCGDFAFEVSNENATSRLSVVVERKLIGDLVQRSAKADHWKQCQRMRDNFDQAIMLIENDTLLAARFDAYGGLNLEPTPSNHAIENVADVFRFIGRAIISSRKMKFIQTQNQQGTFRSIGALALMAAESSKIGRNAPVSTPAAGSEQQRLKKRLTDGGVNWRVADAVAREIGSIAALESLFASCSTERARNMVLIPLVCNIQSQQALGCPRKWSAIIAKAMVSTPQDRSKAAKTIAEIKDIFGEQLPCDEATLTKNVYEQDSKDAVVEKCMKVGSSTLPLPDRKVKIELSKKFERCFPESADGTFYQCSTKEQSAAVIMRTESNDLVSGALRIYVKEGADFLNLVVAAMLEAKRNPDYVAMAKDIARKLHRSFSPPITKSVDRQVVIVRGLHYALLAAAKTSSYRNETKVLCEMVMAVLMLDYNYVVLQGIRKKEDEVDMILQQLALACFHYQYLTRVKI